MDKEEYAFCSLLTSAEGRFHKFSPLFAIILRTASKKSASDVGGPLRRPGRLPPGGGQASSMDGSRAADGGRARGGAGNGGGQLKRLKTAVVSKRFWLRTQSSWVKAKLCLRW